jgi:heptosyltransferase-1
LKIVPALCKLNFCGKRKSRLKILIVKLSSIGDTVHCLPALAAINQALPQARISWAVERTSAEILRANNLIERLIEIDTHGLRREKKWRTKLNSAQNQFRTLKSENYDVALDFQGLLKSALIARISGAPRRVGFDKKNLREPPSRFFLTETIEIPQRINVIEKNLRLAAGALKIEIPKSAADYKFPITTDVEHRAEAERIVEQSGENFIILNPGGGWRTKLWAAEKFGVLSDAIFDKFGLRSVVMSNPREENLAKAVLSASVRQRAIAAKMSLKGFYELAKRACLYVGGDTSLTHLAVAANAPVIGIFGPTEWWRNGSPHAQDISVERFDIDCRENCHRRTCGNWICMNIEVRRVLRAVEKRIENKNLESQKIFIS